MIAVFGEDIVKFRSCLVGDMVAAGHRVIACGPDQPAMRLGIAETGAEYLPISLNRTGVNPLHGLVEVFVVARLFRDIDPDIVFTFGTKHNLIGILAARLVEVPRIFSLIPGLGYAFSPGDELKRRIVRRCLSLLYRRAFQCCTAVFVQNEDDQRLVREKGWVAPEQPVIRTFGTGINIKRFSYSPPEIGPPRVLLIARLLREKGIADFVEAARIVRRRCPQSRFQLLGPFDTNPGAIDQAQVLRWQDEGLIEYLGETTDVRPFLRFCNIYCLPSIYREGVPRTILEALAIGRAIVTTDAPGCRETVVEGINGFLVPPRDPSALAFAIERFIDNPDLTRSMGEASRHMAEIRCDVHQVNATIMAAMGLGDIGPDEEPIGQLGRARI